jgi:hypothetical protein
VVSPVDVRLGFDQEGRPPVLTMVWPTVGPMLGEEEPP